MSKAVTLVRHLFDVGVLLCMLFVYIVLLSIGTVFSVIGRQFAKLRETGGTVKRRSRSVLR